MVVQRFRGLYMVISRMRLESNPSITASALSNPCRLLTHPEGKRPRSTFLAGFRSSNG